MIYDIYCQIYTSVAGMKMLDSESKYTEFPTAACSVIRVIEKVVADLLNGITAARYYKEQHILSWDNLCLETFTWASGTSQQWWNIFSRGKLKQIEEEVQGGTNDSSPLVQHGRHRKWCIQLFEALFFLWSALKLYKQKTTQTFSYNNYKVKYGQESGAWTKNDCRGDQWQ